MWGEGEGEGEEVQDKVKNDGAVTEINKQK